MPLVNININANQIDKITNYLSYQEEINEQPNPQSRKNFLYGKVQEYLKNCYRAEKSKDGEVARKVALEEAETELASLEVKE